MPLWYLFFSFIFSLRKNKRGGKTVRRKEILLGFNDLKILLQYLYMEPTNCIVIHNCIKVPLRLRMNDRGAVLCKNLNFPDVEETDWTREIMCNITAIVDQLQTVPATEYPDSFKNRWEEIKGISQMLLN